MFDYFLESPNGASEALQYMPPVPFQYYVMNYVKLFAPGQTLPEWWQEARFGADSFLGIVLFTLEHHPNRILPVMEELLPVVEHVAVNQQLYDADPEVFGGLDREMLASDDSLFRLCIDVLGKAKEDFIFDQLIRRLGQESVLVSENEHVTNYECPTSGIELIYSKRRACFGWVAFFVDSPNVRQGSVQRYSGTLLNGIEPSDSMSDVERKIETAPNKRFLGQLPNESTLEYRLPKYDINFYFDGSGEHLSLILVKGKRTRKTARNA